MVNLLAGKHVLVGVTGGIAAYKAGELVRLLIKAGAEVQVIMTDSAKAFVTPLTFQALTGRGVRDSLLDTAAEMGMGHIELGRWADLLVIAPASANAIARLTAGMANDLLTTVALATKAPLAIVPAMNEVMWHNPMTQRNIKKITDIRAGTIIWGPGEGEQACGDYGSGRMIEPQEIVENISAYFYPRQNLSGIKLVLTAGPTRERIDPVRYISNDSSGKMGYALASCAQQAGADVTLISGPVDAQLTQAAAGLSLVKVESAAEMFDATMAAVTKGADIFIAAAAVADYRVNDMSDQKIKKSSSSMSLQLVPNADILATVAAYANPPFCVGFAAETQSLMEYAREKMLRKKVPMMIANDVSRSDIGFNSNDNAVTLLTASSQQTIAKMPKTILAKTLIEKISEAYYKHLQSEPGTKA